MCLLKLDSILTNLSFNDTLYIHTLFIYLHIYLHFNIIQYHINTVLFLYLYCINFDLELEYNLSVFHPSNSISIKCIFIWSNQIYNT